MKSFLLLLLLPALYAGKCGETKISKESREPAPNEDIPACVQQLLDEAAKSTPPVLPIQVDEYVYKGKKVYLFTADCCDFYNLVYDENCKRICAPSGGFTGGGDGKCRDFDSTAKRVKTLWKQRPGKQ